MCDGHKDLTTKQRDRRKRQERQDDLDRMRRGYRGRNESASDYKRRVRNTNKRDKAINKGKYPNSSARGWW